jgi:hypothetical protein
MNARTNHETQQRLERLYALQQRVRDEITVLEAGLTSGKRRRSRHEVPPCGTESAYQRHRYRQEPADDECKTAHAAHERVMSAARRLAKEQRKDRMRGAA